jgi:nucleotide-binding universal stress UspA family protein
MTTLDQFESVFRSAIKPVYQHEITSISRAVIITDLEQETAQEFAGLVQQLLSPQQISTWELITGDQYSSTLDLLQLLERIDTDLICCYRNVHSRAWQHPHSLGSHLDVLIQKTSSPVLVLPHPQAGYAFDHAFEDIRQVLAMTDHMTNDDLLVSYAAEFTGSGGHLHLVHIEDDIIFARYMEAISKISTIDTKSAETALRYQLLKYPREYMDSCKSVLSSQYPGISVDSIVAYGHRLREYLVYVDDLKINLLVMRGKEEDQLAMHGLSYPLAIELRQIPILII